MGTSSITITALTATASLRGNKLAATVSATGPAANLPNLQIDVVEFYASTTNDRTTASKVVEGNPEALHAGLIEETAYYYWARARAVNGSYGDWYPSSATAGVSCTAIGTSPLNFGLANGKIVASVAANALTVAIKTAAGNDPSASDPVYLAFPNSTLSSGSYQIRSITSALSLVISSGSTLETSNNVAFRLWLLGIDTGSAIVLGLIKCTDVNRLAVYPLNEGQLISTTAEGGAGAADSAGVVYTTTARSSKAFRILGYLEWSSGLATAGTWSAGPDIIRLQGVGMPKPGDVVQETRISTGSFTLSNTTTIPLDNTSPQSSEGSAIANWDLSITPTSAINFLDYDAAISMSHHTGSCHVIGAVFRDSNTGASVADAVKINAADDIGRVHLRGRFLGLDTSAHTFAIRVGGSAAGTWTVNGVNGSGMFGSALQSHAGIRELMV